MCNSRLFHSALLGVLVAFGHPPADLGAQTIPNSADASEVRKQLMEDLDSLNSKFVALANAIPADKYSWRPQPGVRSVGEVFMHVASEFYVYTPMAYGATPSTVVAANDAAMKQFEATSTKPVVLKNLADGFVYCQHALSALNPESLSGTRSLFGGKYTIIETSFGMAGDLHEHLGQLIAYARMNGITPPWSK
jgi:DinB superfamily